MSENPKIERGTVVTHIYLAGDLLHVVGKRDDIVKAILTSRVPYITFSVVNQAMEIEEILINTHHVVAISAEHPWSPPGSPTGLDLPKEIERLLTGEGGTPSASI